MTNKRPSNVSWLTWQLYGLQDLRAEALYALLNCGVPALALVPITDLLDLVRGAEYRCKMPLLSAPMFVLGQAELRARLWLD